ncbi:MAG: KEOPS complex kinase/ATPase Bud32 [Nanoarchaeota archaeon]
MVKEIARGAEAVLFRDENLLIKRRLQKSYRYKDLDVILRKQRTKSEYKIMGKVFQLINIPRLVKLGDYEIVMEFIDGDLLSETLEKLNEDGRKTKAQEIGKSIAILHKHNVIHGDLTTSNMILKDKNVYFIDFGLAFISSKIEDKAVDLHLLKEALNSKHYKVAEGVFNHVIKEYVKINGKDIVNRLEKVESRGRYKGKKK